MKYSIVVKETLEKVVVIEANSFDEAVGKAIDDYRMEKIVLDYSDFKSVEIGGEEI